jgi:undecaprenyl phosphate N,N'-diacetylbacillosamine 1-phosphate transferase
LGINFSGIPRTFKQERNCKIEMYTQIFKYLIDFILALFGLLLLSPILLMVWICLCIANQGKPFFFQTRPGKQGKLFKIIKFKTMNDRKDKEGCLLPDRLRLTTIGSFVRRTSLDEIPQLLNVLKGDMSIIGPRPLLPDYLPLYNEEQRKRHEVKPGITGWAQVNGRNAISWGEKFKFDVWYVNNLSFSLDLKIMYLTIKKIAIREGISSSTSVTMEKFNGN